MVHVSLLIWSMMLVGTDAGGPSYKGKASANPHYQSYGGTWSSNDGWYHGGYPNQYPRHGGKGAKGSYNSSYSSGSYTIPAGMCLVPAAVAAGTEQVQSKKRKSKKSKKHKKVESEPSDYSTSPESTPEKRDTKRLNKQKEKELVKLREFKSNIDAECEKKKREEELRKWREEIVAEVRAEATVQRTYPFNSPSESSQMRPADANVPIQLTVWQKIMLEEILGDYINTQLVSNEWTSVEKLVDEMQTNEVNTFLEKKGIQKPKLVKERKRAIIDWLRERIQLQQ